MPSQDVVQYCQALGGNLETSMLGDETVCMVGDFPAPGDDNSIYYDAPMVAQALISNPKTIVIHTTPENAKKLFPPLDIDDVSDEVLERLAARIENQLPVSPPYREMCLPRSWAKNELTQGHEGEFVDHEGRHRIEAAIRAGIDTIPIVIIVKNRTDCGRY